MAGDLKDLLDIESQEALRRAGNERLNAKSKDELFKELEGILSSEGAEDVGVKKDKRAVPAEKLSVVLQASEKHAEPRKEPRMWKIWFIGELEGGTRFTGKENLIGLQREYHDQAEKDEVPDRIYWMGDELPDFGQFLTRGQSAKTEVLEEDVIDLNRAVVAIKPYLTGITDQLLEGKQHTEIGVLVGPNDRDNIRLGHDRIVQMYSKETKYIYAQIQTYADKIAGEEKIVAETTELKKQYETELRKIEQKAAEAERKTLEEKIALIKQLETTLTNLKNTQGADTAPIEVHLTKLKAENGRKVEQLRRDNALRIQERKIHLERMIEKIKENAEEAADDRRIMALYDKLEDLWIEEHKEKSVADIVKEFGERATAELLERVMKIRGLEAVEEVHAITLEQRSKVDNARAGADKELEKEKIERLTAESLALAELGASSAKLIYLNSQLEHTNAQLRSTDRDLEKEKFVSLEKESKMLANRIKKQTKGKVMQVIAAAEKRIHELAEEGELYTHNLPGSPALHELAEEIAVEEVLEHKRNAYGRRVNIDLMSNIINDRNVGFDYKVRISNNPKNTSQNYLRANMKDLKAEAQMGDVDGVRFVVLGHSQDSIATIVPLKDKSEKIMHLYTTSLFLDVDKLKQVWNESGIRGVKTRVTETVTKGPVSSGFWEVAFDDARVIETFRTRHYLADQANREKRAQIAQLISKLRNLPHEPLEEETDGIDRIQLRNKLPGDMDDALLSKLLAHNGIDPADESTRKKLVNLLEKLKNSTKEDVRKVAEMPENRDVGRALGWCAEYFFPDKEIDMKYRITVIMINDTHIGTTGYGVPTKKLIKAFTEYWKENGDHSAPMLLLFLGDNLEANHKAVKNEMNKEIEVEKNLKRFEEQISKSLSERSELVSVKRDRYAALLLDKLPIINIDRQAAVLVETSKELIQMSNGLIAVSGQHFNKTYPNRDRDEATALATVIDQLTGKRRLPIMPMPGGDSGAGAVTIHEDFGIFVGHKIPKKIENMTLPQKVALGADSHVHEVRILGDLVTAIGSASSVINNYTTEKGIPTSQSGRGFTTLTFTVAKDKRGEWQIHEVVSEHVSLELLRTRGYLKEDEDIRKFEGSLTTMPVRMQAVKMQKVKR